jgi:hypothetical protein
MTDHRDHGDENDNYLKDVRLKSGEIVRRGIITNVYCGDSLYEETITAVNELLKWCEWKDIQPMEFGAEFGQIDSIDNLNIWVKGVQR